MKAKDNRKTPRRRTAGKRSGKAARLERLYRELGFVYSGFATPLRLDGRDSRLAPEDFRPRSDLTFSALSVQ